jgi:hypothetical protein
MIELKGRGFALLATVLSFIADNRDTQESIRWRLGSPAAGPRDIPPRALFSLDAVRNDPTELAQVIYDECTSHTPLAAGPTALFSNGRQLRPTPLGRSADTQRVLTRPRLCARDTACARFSAPSFVKMFLTCDFTVSGPIARARAISLLERP